MTSSSLGLGYEQRKSSTIFSEPDDGRDMPMMSEDLTDTPFPRQPQTSDQISPEILTHVSPCKSSPEVLSITEDSRSDFKPTLEVAQNRHLSPTSAPSHAPPSKTTSMRESSRDEGLSSYSSDKHHRYTPHLQGLTMDSVYHKKFHEDHLTDKNSVATEPDYSDKMSPQEESWVKQLFVAREKSMAQDGAHQRRQHNKVNGDFGKEHFASNTAKFTTMVEEPTASDTTKTGQANNEEPKAGFYQKAKCFC